MWREMTACQILWHISLFFMSSDCVKDPGFFCVSLYMWSFKTTPKDQAQPTDYGFWTLRNSCSQFLAFESLFLNCLNLVHSQWKNNKKDCSLDKFVSLAWIDVPMSGRCGMQQRAGDASGFTPAIRELCATPVGPPAGDTFSPAHLTTRLWSLMWRRVSSSSISFCSSEEPNVK